MKSVKDLLKRIIVRSSAFVTALALLPCAISYSVVNAEGEDDAVRAGLDKASESIEIYQDGVKQPIEAKAVISWDESGVEGDLSPTQKALSVEEFAGTGTKTAINENIYTLSVATGINPGKTVEFFAVRYTDANDKPQTKYIFPKIHSLEATYRYVESIRSNNNSSAALTDDPITIEKKHKALSDIGYNITEPSVPDALQAWSVDEYLFETESDIKKVNSIDVFMSKGKWTVQGMSVSKVTSVGGYGEYGFISGKYFLSLGKQYLCRLKNKGKGARTFDTPGDRIFSIGSDKSNYYTLEEITSTDSVSDPSLDLYSFRIDFADRPDAGLESLLRSKADVKRLRDGVIAEDIAVEVEYRDKNGWTRNVSMPVLLSVITQGMMSEQDEGVATVGLAQQGDTLAFTACLPEYEKLISYKLHTGSKARTRIKESGGIKRKSDSEEGSLLEDELDKDYIQVVGVSIYQGTCRISNTPEGVDTVTGQTLESYTYAFDFLEQDPMIYFSTAKATGKRVSPGSSVTFSLMDYNPEDPLIAEDNTYNILVRLRTDTIDGSGSDGNLKMRLNYIDKNGVEKISKYFTVKQEVLNYLGYWPSYKERQSNYAYLQGMSEGNYVEFPLSLSDVGAVSSVELSLDNYTNDEWQTSGVYIGVLDTIGGRRIYKQVSSAGSVESDYRIVRSSESAYIPPFPIGVQLLLTPGRTYKISAGSGTVISSADTVDFESVRYSMSFEQTSLDLGYVKTAKTYDVTVKVADDPTANSINGDSGSNNHFFFQLRFKNGSSAFVLANQQLSSDGFRAGCSEMFSISVNRDYNELTAIRIIPEDSTNDSNEFDKLNIEYITVTERAYGGTSIQYVIDDVGWIEIDYHDEAEGSAIIGSSGRTVGDVARTFSVSYQRDVVNLYCEIEALPWIVDDPDFDQTTSSKFKDSLSANVDYIDYDGQPQTMSFDVVSRMYDYMNKTPVSYEAKSDGSNQALCDNMGTISDPEWMLRPGHKDRVSFPPLPNAKTITSITLQGTNRSKGQAQWVIGGLSLYTIITDSGVISLTADKEYYRKMETEALCMMEFEDLSTKYVQLLLPSGMSEPVTIPLSYNELPKLTVGGWTPAVTKFPESTNDSLNVYIYPSKESRSISTYKYDEDDPTKITEVNDVAVSAAIQYNLPFSKVMQINQNPLRVYGSGTEDAVFYYPGLSAENMQSLKKLSISCRDSSILFDHAIIQQVRDSVIVNTYTMTLGHASAIMELSAVPSKSVTVYDNKKQKILLSFGANTKEAALFGSSGSGGSVRDIAIAFKYRSSLDKAMGSRMPEYYTPYIYLTEVGINRIGPGLMAEIPMEIPYVQDITGYRLVSFGNLEATVDSAMIMNYSYERKDKDIIRGTYTYIGEKLEECYSFHDSYNVSSTNTNHNRVAKGMSGTGTLNPIDLIFTTDTEKTGSLFSDSEVVLSLNYKSGTATKTKMILDARKYIQAENQQFVTYSEPDDTGKRELISNTARVRLFIPECDELTSIDLRIADDSASSVWYVKSIEGTTNYGTVDLHKKTDIQITSTRQNLNFEKVSLMTYVSSSDNRQQLVKNNEIGLTVNSNDTVTGIIRMGNKETFGIKVELLANDKMTAVSKEYYYTTSDGFTFITPVNAGTVAQTYVITVYSVKNPSVYDIINITVPVPESDDQSNYYPHDNNETSYDRYVEDEPIEDEPSEDEPSENEPSEDESGDDEPSVESIDEGEQSSEEPNIEEPEIEVSDDEESTNNEP